MKNHVSIKTSTIIKCSFVAYIAVTIVKGLDRELGQKLGPKLDAWEAKMNTRK